MRDFQAFDRGFVGVRFQIRGRHLDRKTARRRPGGHRFVLLVEQPDDQVAAAVDAVVGDIFQPGVEVEVAFELAAFERDVAVLDHAGHADFVEILAVAVPVFDFFPLHDQAGDFGETDLCAAPIDLEMEARNWIFLCHDVYPSVLDGWSLAFGFQSGFRHFVRELEDDELGRTHGGHADFDNHAAFQDVQRGHGFA